MKDSELEQALWEIIREVAASDPTYVNDYGDFCIYCNDYGKEFMHESTCLYLKAKALAEKGILAW